MEAATDTVQTAPADPGAVEAAARELSPRERRKLREAARRLVMREERERIQAQRGGEAPADEAPAAGSAPSAPAAPAPAAPLVSDADLAAAMSAFLRGVLVPLSAVLTFLVTPFRLELPRYTVEDANADGPLWVPMLRRHPRLAVLVTYGTGPARLIERIRALAVRKEPTP